MTPRYKTCRECGLEWNVSITAKIPFNGYLCPVCRGKHRKEAQTRENSLKENNGTNGGGLRRNA